MVDGAIPFGTVSQYGIFKAKSFTEIIIAERQKNVENRKIT